MRSTSRTALAALILGTALCTQALAQNEVRIFEEAPSLEELRAILIPEAGAGISRRIEIVRTDDIGARSPIRPTTATAASPPTPQPTLTRSKTADPADPAAAAAKTAEVTPPALPRHAAAVRDTATVVGFRINFASSSDAIPLSYRAHLDRIVELMHREPMLALTIEGHTDAYGSAEYNLELSRRRAVAVMRYLVGQGVEAERLVAVGKGKTAPLLDNPFDGRNRRVQFLNANPRS